MGLEGCLGEKHASNELQMWHEALLFELIYKFRNTRNKNAKQTKKIH